MDKDLEVTISIRNNKVKAARLQLGLSQKKLGERLGISSSTICAAECMRMKGVSQEAREILADLVGLPVKEVFPDWMDDLKTNKSVRQMNLDELPILQEQVEYLLMGDVPLDPEEHVRQKELAAILKDKLSILEEHVPFYAEILKAKLEGRTLSEVAESTGLSKARIQQILEKAVGFVRYSRPEKIVPRRSKYYVSEEEDG